MTDATNDSPQPLVDDSCGASLTANCFNGETGCRVHPTSEWRARQEERRSVLIERFGVGPAAVSIEDIEDIDAITAILLDQISGPRRSAEQVAVRAVTELARAGHRAGDVEALQNARALAGELASLHGKGDRKQ